MSEYSIHQVVNKVLDEIVPLPCQDHGPEVALTDSERERFCIAQFSIMVNQLVEANIPLDIIFEALLAALISAASQDRQAIMHLANVAAGASGALAKELCLRQAR
jgi:hypothetical protein